MSGESFSMDTRDFERGVEFGLLYARVQDYGRAVMAVHADLMEQVTENLAAAGKSVRTEPHEHDAGCREVHDDEDYLDVVIGLDARELVEGWRP